MGVRAGLKPEGCYVIAADVSGNRVPDCGIRVDGGGCLSGPLRNGDSFTLTVPLMRCCHFEKPGLYNVRVAYELLWSKNESDAIPKDDPKWVEATITSMMPDAAQARGVVGEMCRNPFWFHGHTYEHERDRGSLPEFADFTCLQYPVYLPILAELTAGKEGDERALTGIAHIPTDEATETLVRLLRHPNRDFALKAAGALNDRLPEPLAGHPHKWANPIQLEDADPKLVRGTWRGDLDPAVRRFACELLAKKKPETLAMCGVHVGGGRGGG